QMLYGLDRLKRITQLVKAGYPNNSISEQLAIEDELALFTPRRTKIPETVLRDAKNYGASHLLNDLASIAVERPLSFRERRSFAKAGRDFIHSRGTLDSTTLAYLNQYRRRVSLLPWFQPQF